jgi:hypothetical protein
VYKQHHKDLSVTIEHKVEFLEPLSDNFRIQYTYELFGEGKTLTSDTLLSLAVDDSVAYILNRKRGVTRPEARRAFDNGPKVWDARLLEHKLVGPDTYRAIIRVKKKG